jgi:aryl-alcohol dehydrogenase-like predicted oxidoreductase
MKPATRQLTRRAFLVATAALGAVTSLARPAGSGTAATPLTKAIPKTGERLPVIGMGTWRTFNVGQNQLAREVRVEVLEAFFEGGGGLIDSSPMYGSSEEVIGYCLERIANHQDGLFAATKVWTMVRRPPDGELRAPVGPGAVRFDAGP